MKYSKKRAREFVQILKTARPLIEFGHNNFVCPAVDAVTESHLGDALKFWIAQDQLGGVFTAYGWLVKQGVKTDELTHENMRQWRLMWIDKMIKHWEGVAK